MNNTLLKEECNNPNRIPIPSDEENNEIIFNLIEEIHIKFGFTRSKL